MRNWYQENKEKHIVYVRNRDKKIKLWLKEYKKTLKCEECGENHPACLDFHHINPKEKKFAIGRIKDFLSWRGLKEEIAKCRVLCANCHRKKHYELKEKEQNRS
jgi:5-methylcytosine-specific restriction endonuclease McrA